MPDALTPSDAAAAPPHPGEAARPEAARPEVGAAGDVIRSLDDVRASLTPTDTVVGAESSSPPPADSLPAAAGRFSWVRTRVPLLLFLLTCVSMYFAGEHFYATPDSLTPYFTIASLPKVSPHGLEYMTLGVAILLAHELGHFLQAVRYHIPASWPLFVPFPLSPFGTMGAVIAMDGRKCSRRQMFDIGVSGPLAGLVIAIPLAMYGIWTWNGIEPVPNPQIPDFYLPLGIEWLIAWLRPDVTQGHRLFHSPMLAASYIGVLITGLNMMPVGQLDGGHIIYTLFGRRAMLIAGAFIAVACVYVVIEDAFQWFVMLLLIIFVGPFHPPTTDEDQPLGPVRWAIGLASLTIPFLGFPLEGLGR